MKISVSRAYLWYFMYALLIFSVEISHLLESSYAGIMTLLIALYGAASLRKLFLRLSAALREENIVKNYTYSFLLIFSGIVLGSIGISIGVYAGNMPIILFSVIFSYLIALLGTYLFRESCAIITRLCGLYSVVRLGNVSLIIALIYPVYFLMDIPYSTLFLCILYVALMFFASRALKAIEKILEESSRQYL
ncbi:MAG: hypothetical protein DRN26_06140 [Thermoplasmata archaeon]|nr:MAG: hypothetical protein DRN26_06140 [Thermoplasmata archaeon]